MDDKIIQMPSGAAKENKETIAEAPKQAPQPVDWVAVRMDAEKQLVAGVKALQRLEQVSKGAGKPSLHELVSLFVHVAVYLNTLPRELVEMGRALSSLFISGSVRLDTVIALLIEKGVFTEEEFKTRGMELVKAQGEAIAAARAERVEKAVQESEAETK